MKFKKGDYLISAGGSKVIHKVIRCNIKTYRLLCVYNPYSFKPYNQRLQAEGLWSPIDLPGNEWSRSFGWVERNYKKYPKLKGVLYEEL